MRAFIAVYPDEAARGELVDVAPNDADDVRVADMADWHVTLRFLGEIDAATMAAVERVASVALRTVEPLHCRLGPTTALGSGAKVLFVPAEGVERAVRVLDTVLDGVAEDRDGPFRGHLTLARARGRGRLPSTLSGMPVDVGFEVTEAALVVSRLDPERAIHQVVARFALGAHEDPSRRTGVRVS